MSENRKSKAFSKIVTILIIGILFSSITISILAWNYGLLDSQNYNIESEVPFEEPTSPQPSPEPEIPNEDPTEPEQPAP